jgi:hypothetical protein
VARIWKEPFREDKHCSCPIEYWGTLDAHIRAPGLIPKEVLMVSVASFTFQFFSSRQLRDCLAYYERKTHPSSRLSVGAADHWEVQRWFERLPMYLLEDPKRQKVVKALSQALRLAEADESSAPSQRATIGKIPFA